MGEHLQSVSKDMETYSIREPLGVCAGNFFLSFSFFSSNFHNFDDYYFFLF